MKIFSKVAEPSGFAKAKQDGLDWIAKNPKSSRGKKKGKKNGSSRPKDFWSPFKPDLAHGFRNLCGYCYMYDPSGGSVDHYISCDSDDLKAYEWANYRFAMAWLNSSKQNEDDRVVDPYEAEFEWFEILLPSMQMVMTDQVPAPLKAKVQHTLVRLHLVDDERVLRPRREWYRMYQDGELTLDGLRKKAPLIARAVDKQVTASGAGP